MTPDTDTSQDTVRADGYTHDPVGDDLDTIEPAADDCPPDRLVNAVAVMRDPRELTIAGNVRETFTLTDHPELADSIAEHGVLTPIIAYGRPDDPTVVVRDGQLRTLTAIAVGITEVPVWLIAPDPTVTVKDSEISRILEQITVNDRRIPLTDGDRAAGIALALDLGATVTRVGKALQTTREHVKAAGKVGSSATARTAIDTGQLDFDQAAILAEYETLGDINAVTRLLAVTGDRFHYQARLIANDRADERTYFAAALAWAQAGFGILRDYPTSEGLDADLVHAGDLVDASGDLVDVDRLDAEAGWLVWLELADDPLIVHRETGAIIDATEVDWATGRDPDAEPGQGLRHAREVDQLPRWQADYFLPVDRCADAGVRLVADLPADEPASKGGDAQAHADQAVAREQLLAQRAQIHAEADARREEERVAARRVRELNKQGLAAMQVRRAFVTELLARKTPPVEAARFVAEALVTHPNLLGEYNAFETAAELLGGEKTWRRDLTQMVEAAKPARCHVIVLGLVLGAYEKRTGKDSWRYSGADVAHYLRFLREVGHQLVPVELATIGELDHTDIDIDAHSPDSPPS
ncbi:ParB/RepB/Spo0J family partition protein [Nocardia sp. NPDC058658]|uniref:ParB/RepB/Spo0J family partition protein n=1 Tax=Nocardia sp. NPDC058658 TaxID=3346580 RepID=UPI00364DCB18